MFVEKIREPSCQLWAWNLSREEGDVNERGQEAVAADIGDNWKVQCHEVKLEMFQVEDSQLGNNNTASLK